MKGVSYQFVVLPGGKLPGPISKAIRSVLEGSVGKIVNVTVAQQEKIRSLKQNAFYWGFVIPPIRKRLIEAGNMMTPKQVHELIRQSVADSIFAMTIILPNGQPRIIYRSSTELTTTEWEDFVTLVRAWAGQWDIIIPFPNEVAVEIDDEKGVDAEINY
jgi:hypothetical protein